MIIGIPAFLHDALSAMAHSTVELSGLLGSLNGAVSDHTKLYGNLIDAIAKYAKAAEELRDAANEAEEDSEIVEGARASGAAEGAERHDQMAPCSGEATSGQ